MSKKEKNNPLILILTIVQAIINISIIIISNGKYVGGEIGMAPFITAIVLFYQVIISGIIYFLLYRIIKIAYVYFIINMIVYVVVLYRIDSASFKYFFEDDLSGFFVRSSILSSFISTILVILIHRKWSKE